MDLLVRFVEGLDGTDESVVQSRVDLSVSQTTDDEQSQISVLMADSYLVKKLELSSRRNPGDISVWFTAGLRVREVLSDRGTTVSAHVIGANPCFWCRSAHVFGTGPCFWCQPMFLVLFRAMFLVLAHVLDRDGRQQSETIVKVEVTIHFL